MKNFYYTLAAILGFVNMVGIIAIMYVVLNQMIETLSDYSIIEAIFLVLALYFVVIWKYK